MTELLEGLHVLHGLLTASFQHIFVAHALALPTVHTQRPTQQVCDVVAEDLQTNFDRSKSLRNSLNFELKGTVEGFNALKCFKECNSM